MVKESLQVGIGAACGAVLRYLVLLPIPDSAPVIAQWTALLVLNAIGCFAMGALAPGPFLGVGVLGGFTSFSAMAVAAMTSSIVASLIGVGAHVIICVSAWLAGNRFHSSRLEKA